VTRQIKFRGKRLDNGKWVWGFYFRTGLNRHYIKSHTDLKDYEVDLASVGQFIGIQDVLGRDIYDGDILQSEDGATGRVEWCEDEAGYRYVKDDPRRFQYFVDAYPGLKHQEIIGTIHDKEATQCTK